LFVGGGFIGEGIIAGLVGALVGKAGVGAEFPPTVIGGVVGAGLVGGLVVAAGVGAEFPPTVIGGGVGFATGKGVGSGARVLLTCVDDPPGDNCGTEPFNGFCGSIRSVSCAPGSFKGFCGSCRSPSGEVNGLGGK
jgi:hypothetical protein